MKIYTKTGDQGQTSIIGGTRLSKAHIRIEAYGTVDELNAYIGLLNDQSIDNKYKEILSQVQDRLFTIGASLAADPVKSKMKIPDLLDSDLEILEEAIDEMTTQLPEMRNFILPGGHTIISYGHIARTVCRRAERNCIALAEQDFVAELVIKYLNRLSDFLFTLCRKLHDDLNVAEIPWRPRT